MTPERTIEVFAREAGLTAGLGRTEPVVERDWFDDDPRADARPFRRTIRIDGYEIPVEFDTNAGRIQIPEGAEVLGISSNGGDIVIGRNAKVLAIDTNAGNVEIHEGARVGVVKTNAGSVSMHPDATLYRFDSNAGNLAVWDRTEPASSQSQLVRQADARPGA